MPRLHVDGVQLLEHEVNVELVASWPFVHWSFLCHFPIDLSLQRSEFPSLTVTYFVFAAMARSSSSRLSRRSSRPCALSGTTSCRSQTYLRTSKCVLDRPVLFLHYNLILRKKSLVTREKIMQCFGKVYGSSHLRISICIGCSISWRRLIRVLVHDFRLMQITMLRKFGNSTIKVKKAFSNFKKYS